MFVFNEIHVNGSKIIYDHIWVLNVSKNIPIEYPRVHEEGPMIGVQDCPRQPTNGRQSTPSGSINALLVVAHRLALSLGDKRPMLSLLINRQNDMMVRLWTNGPSTTNR